MAKKSTWRIIEDSVPQYQFAGPVGYELKDRNYLKPYVPSEPVSEQVSGFPYDEYLANANRYLTRPIFEGTPLNAKLIANAAKEFYGKTNYVYPLELLLSQAQFETSLGKKLKSKHNYFNVGNTDSGATRDYPSAEDSMQDYMNLMYNDYLNKGQRSVESLLKPKSFVNMEGNRYASNPEYEQKLKSQVQYIKKFLSSKQVGGSKGKDKTREPIPGAAELWQNYRNPNTVVAIGNPNNPNDTLRYFPGRPQVGGRIVVSDAEGTPVLSQENVYELMKQPNTRVYQDSTLVNKYIPKAYGGGLSKAQNGTEINSLEGDLITKVLMNRNLDKDFIQRAYALGQNPRMFSLPDPNEFGSYMSHKMSWGEDDQGQAYMFPTVMNPRNESIKVPNQYADYISSIGYKKEAGMPYKAYGGKITPESKKVRKYGPGGSTAYEAWYKYNTPEGREGFPDSYSSYDYQRYYNDAVKGVNPMGFDEGSQHFPDTYKYPWHPSFSDESIYYTNQKETPALSYNTKADWKEYLKSKRSKLKATRAKGGPVWSIVEKLPKAQMGVQLPVNPQTGMPVVNLPEVEVSPNSPWLDRHLRQLSKREDGITQLGFADPVTIGALAAFAPFATIPGAISELASATGAGLNAPIAGVPGASLNNLMAAGAYTASMNSLLNPNSALRQSAVEAGTNPNMNTVPKLIEEGLWTGLGFLGTPSPVTGAAKKAAGYAQSKLPIYINPNYAKNQIRSQYPLFTNTTLSKMASNEPLIKYPILGSAAGLTAGSVSAAFNDNNISHKERVQYRKLLSKQRRGEPLTNQEAAYLDNYDDKIQDISNQNVNTLLTSIGVGGLSGLAYGIGARNLNALRNFKNYGRESWPAEEAQALSTIDPERSLRLMEARNNYWSNQPRVMTLEESELLNFYGQGKAGDYIHPPKERVSIFGEVQPRPTLQRSSSQNPPDDFYDYYSTGEYRLQEQLDRERMAAEIERQADQAQHLSYVMRTTGPNTSTLRQFIEENPTWRSLADDYVSYMEFNGIRNARQQLDNYLSGSGEMPLLYNRNRGVFNYTDRPQGFNISRNENPNYVISTPTPQPRVVNRSGLTKEEVLQKATSKDKEVLSKMTDQEFQSTVLKPTGEIVSYELNLASPFGKSEPPLSLSTKDYVNEFNSRLDLLNDIIAKKNKTGIEYKVTGLTEDGRLLFETPSMSNSTRSWTVGITPGQWRGQIEDIANTNYYRSIPGLEMRNTSSSVFGDMIPRKGSGAYESINEYLKALDLGRLKPGFNSQTEFSRSAWENFIKSGRGVGFYNNPYTVYGIMKKPGGAIATEKLKNKKAKGGKVTWQIID